MQYLVQNKVNYLPLTFPTNIVTWDSINNKANNSTFNSPLVYHTDKKRTNTNYYGTKTNIEYKRQDNTRMFDIFNQDFSDTYSELIIPNLFLSFTCSNIMAINSNDFITITVTFKTDVDLVTRNYMYPIKQQFMNTFQIFDYFFVDFYENIKISAISTIPLTLLPPVNLTKNLIYYSYLMRI